MKKSLTVRMDIDVLNRLTKIAEGENKSLARIVQQAAQNYIQAYTIPILDGNKEHNVRQKKPFVRHSDETIVRQDTNVLHPNTGIVLHGQTEPKTPEPNQKPNSQLIKTQPIRAYKPRPNPNKALFDKINH